MMSRIEMSDSEFTKFQDDFYNLLHGFCVNGRSILVVSHDINLVFKHADKILEIKDGNIKEVPKH